MGTTRAIRFTEADERQIQEFLNLSPFFDFSSLARTALLSFIENPQLKLKPVIAHKKTSHARKAKEQTL